MLRAYVPGEPTKRPPRSKGERATCRCGASLLAVIPLDYTPHWRHPGGDCDPWSEPEGPWHLAWKGRFPPECQEVELQDEVSSEWHRADVRCVGPPGHAVVLELQYSSISIEEQRAREAFYQRQHRLFWLLHIRDERGSFRGWSMRASLTTEDPVDHQRRRFYRLRWRGRSSSFIDRWKQSPAHVFLELDGQLFYLATRESCAPLVTGMTKGQFALLPLTAAQLVDAVARSQA